MDSRDLLLCCRHTRGFFCGHPITKSPAQVIHLSIHGLTILVRPTVGVKHCMRSAHLHVLRTFKPIRVIIRPIASLCIHFILEQTLDFLVVSTGK